MVFGIKSTPHRFWKWFRGHETELFELEKDRERIFNSLSAQLKKINRDLVFEFGPVKDGKREFVISAGGIKNAFHSVTELVGSAPNMELWKITAFRPRRYPLNILHYKGKVLDPENIQFALIDDGEKIGIYLFIPGYQEEEIVWKEMGYLFLDEALGEYDVEVGVGPIRMFSSNHTNSYTRYPLKDLADSFDRHAAKLKGLEKSVVH